MVGWLVVGIKPIVFLKDLGLRTRCPRWVFFKGLARIYVSFGENHGKLRKAITTRVTVYWTRHILSTSLRAEPLQSELFRDSTLKFTHSALSVAFLAYSTCSWLQRWRRKTWKTIRISSNSSILSNIIIIRKFQVEC